MHLHYLTLKRQADFLHGMLSGATVADSYTQNKNEWVIAVADEGAASSGLTLSCDARLPFALWSERLHRARNSTTVMDALIGRRFAVVDIMPGERVLRAALEDTALRLLIRLFTGHANFFLVDDDNLISDSFKSARKWKGQAFTLPQNNLADPQALDPETIAALAAAHPQKTFNGLLRGFQMLTRPVIGELLYRSNIPAKLPAGEARNAQLNALAAHLKNFLDSCRHDAPRIYFNGEMPERFALTDLHSLATLQTETYPDINTALRGFCLQQQRFRELYQKRSTLSNAVNRRITSLQHHLGQLENQPVSEDRRTQYQEIGELIAAQPQQLKPGQTTAILVNYYHPDMPELKVAVEPELSAQENAERYFHKARRSAERSAERVQRWELLQTELAELQQLHEQITQANDYKTLRKLEDTLKAMRLLQHHPDEAGQFRLPYKTYTFNSWEIWVGKSARDNDTLTFKHARKEDFWLHVQGYAGSHVILRNPDRRDHPPQDVLVYAARLAVTNSQARHASYVPVGYTRVKYVRKPRKSPPGTVIPDRVKSIFVDPL